MECVLNKNVILSNILCMYVSKSMKPLTKVPLMSHFLYHCHNWQGYEFIEVCIIRQSNEAESYKIGFVPTLF